MLLRFRGNAVPAHIAHLLPYPLISSQEGSGSFSDGTLVSRGDTELESKCPLEVNKLRKCEPVSSRHLTMRGIDLSPNGLVVYVSAQLMELLVSQL